MDKVYYKRNSKFSMTKSKYSKSQTVFLDDSIKSTKDEITPVSTYSEVTVDSYTSKKSTKLSYLQANLESETPIPYTFRTAEPIKSLESYEAKSPPFYLQLDHTIAVLWQIFDRNKNFNNNSIGVGQLQWALYFLKGIKDPLEGTRSSDVEIAIKIIEDILMENYADMANIVLRSQPHSLISLPTDSKKSINSSSSNFSSTASLGVQIKPRRSPTNSMNYIFQTKEATPKKPERKYSHVEKKRKNLNQKFRNLSSISEKYMPETELQKPNDIYQLMNRIKQEQIEKINEDIRNLGHVKKKDVLNSISSAVNEFSYYNKLQPVSYDFN